MIELRAYAYTSSGPLISCLVLRYDFDDVVVLVSAEIYWEYVRGIKRVKTLQAWRHTPARNRK